MSKILPPDGTSLLGVLTSRSEPHAPWLVDVDDGVVTVGEALEGVVRWTHAYREIGVEPGDHVVTMRHNTVDALLGWLALSSIGAVEVPINTDYRGRLLAHALTLTRARVMAVEFRYLDRLATVGEPLDHLRTVVVLDAGDAELPTLPFGLGLRRPPTGDGGPVALGTLRVPAPWEIAAVVFTSGTTGRSKAVRVPWAQLHATATGAFPLDDLGRNDVVYSPGPTYHVGAKAFPFLAALVGCRVLLRPYPSATEGLLDLRQHGVTTLRTFSGWPIDDWMAEPEQPDDHQRPLRNLLLPGPRSGLSDFRRRFACRTFRLYNMTELSCPLVSPAWDDDRTDAHGRVSCGQIRPGWPGYEVRLVDEHDREVPAGRLGELVVRTSEPWTVNAGYLGDPDATASAWRNGWFHTGDLFVCDGDGYFYFVDRAKDCIRRRGENISSLEVEQHVLEHPSVAEAAAVGLSDPGGRTDEEVKVAVVLESGASLTEEALVRWLAPRMPRFMVPRYIELVEWLPRTDTGKVRKADLRVPLSETTWDRVAAGVDVPR